MLSVKNPSRKWWFFVIPKWEWELVYLIGMRKRLWIIPGGGHKPTDTCYRWMITYFRSLGFEVQMITVDWNRRVMTDWIADFRSQFSKERGVEDYILGFSFGAMIAFLTANETKPMKLFLCSLSPYFKEDMDFLENKRDVRYFGTRRLADIRKYVFKDHVKNISASTIVFCGGQETTKYPTLLKRCKAAVEQIKRARLVIAENAPHQIDHPSYIEAIKKNIK